MCTLNVSLLQAFSHNNHHISFPTRTLQNWNFMSTHPSPSHKRKKFLCVFNRFKLFLSLPLYNIAIVRDSVIRHLHFLRLLYRFPLSKSAELPHIFILRISLNFSENPSIGSKHPTFSAFVSYLPSAGTDLFQPHFSQSFLSSTSIIESNAKVVSCPVVALLGGSIRYLFSKTTCKWSYGAASESFTFPGFFTALLSSLRRQSLIV